MILFSEPLPYSRNQKVTLIQIFIFEKLLIFEKSIYN